MHLQDEMRVNDVCVQKLDDRYFKDAAIDVDVLRLDKIHPIISGNKWFKLKYYLQNAVEQNYDSVATFGGAFSNHILATAYACSHQSIKCTGYIRGEKPKHLSQTLLDAQSLNMHLEFLSRKDFSNRDDIVQANPTVFFIPEGGYGKTGAKGAEEILQLVTGLHKYSYVVCACGTGTTLAGITNASTNRQKCIGISVMKNNFSLEREAFMLIHEEAASRVKILHDYHFGGYAKYNDELIQFMNRMRSAHNLPLDFVYTTKALYAIYDLAENKFFAPGSNILFLHSGGLQGNRSIPDGTLLSV